MEGHDAHHLDPSAATAASATEANHATMAYWKGNAPDTVVSPIHERAAAGSQVPQTEAVQSRRPSDDASSVPNGPQDDATTFQPIKKSSTDPMGDKNVLQDGPPAQRSGSTPTVDPTRPSLPKGSSKNRTERPAYTQRTSTMMKGLRRAATGTQPSNTGHQYSYTFDPMSSDSDSSSSSEDDGPAKKRKMPRKKEGNQDALGWDGSEKQRKADAKAGRSYSRFKLSNSNVKTKGRISKNDGRLKISMNETENNGYVAKALGKSIKNHLDIPPKHGQGYQHELDQEDLEKAQRIESKAESVADTLRPKVHCPRLNIVVMVIGSRGDIQPFIRVGKLLKEKNGHRVRIATHPAFKDFVSESGLEFFSVGGNPSELMAFMVKNPGLIPNMSTVMEGEIGRRREQMAEMFEGFWRACVNSTDDERDPNNVHLMNRGNPFIADAIIANPPSFAHVHIAERLGIPLHMMFTFPYSPTQAFPHPLANIKPQKSNVNESYINFMSYPLVEMMTFQGLGDLVNNFRERTLGLEPVSQIWAPGALYRMKVPYTYMWSPSLVPKPKDWGPEIDIGGFVFLDLASDFEPPQDLQDFLDAGDQPVYIGFGSIVVDDADAFTQMIFQAVEIAGVRALVNKGWGGLGGEGNDTPDNIFMLGNTPHDWLFPRVKAVIHHGGAGTTAMGLKCGKPTMIVPFFGDQPFWGAMVADAKAGAHECIPYKKLNAERLAEGIKQCMMEESQVNVQKIADSIAAEGDGAENAVRSFHRSLPVAGPKNMRCSILEDRAAVWVVRGSSLRLSTMAAQILVEKEKLKWHDLKILRHYEWNDFDGPGEPITGTGSALMSSMFDIGEGVGMVPVRIAKHVKKREEHTRRKEAVARKKEQRKQKKAAQAAGKVNPLEDPVAQTPAEPPRARYEDNGGARPKVRRDGTNNTVASTISADPEEPLAQEVAEDIGRGFKSSGAALLTMPMDVHMAIAQGFHNAPRLWGDATVRKPVRITGFKSGWTAARREFGYGVWDGWTGLVTQPARGWKDEVTVPAKFGGLGVGVAKGVGGLVIKNVSAIVSPPAYLVTGVRKYVSKRLGGPGANLFIRRAHMVQGFKDVRELGGESGGDPHHRKLEETTREVLEGWAVYEDLWTEVTNLQHAHGNGPLAKMKVAKEKKRWDEMGALESVRTAREALRAYREHEDVDALFKEKRKETLVSQMPRASAMQRTATYGDQGVLTNGRKVGELDEGTIEEVKEDVDAVDAGGAERQEAMDVVAPAAGEADAGEAANAGLEGRKDSEATAVPSDSNDGGEDRKDRKDRKTVAPAAVAATAADASDNSSEDYFSTQVSPDKPKLAGRELSKMQVGPERLDMAAAAPNGVATA